MGPKVYCAWPGIEHNKGQRTTPSGDIPREHYRQHCQYRVRGLRYIARGLASSIMKRNMHISNRWRHILNARNYRKKYIYVMSVTVFRRWALPYLGDEHFRNQINKSVFPYSGLNSVTNTEEYGGCTGLHAVPLWSSPAAVRVISCQPSRGPDVVTWSCLLPTACRTTAGTCSKRRTVDWSAPTPATVSRGVSNGQQGVSNGQQGGQQWSGAGFIEKI